MVWVYPNGFSSLDNEKRDMKKNYTAFSMIGLVIIVLLFYRQWFGFTPLSAGDWSFHFPAEIAHFFLLPSSWMFWLGGELGGNGVYLSGLETYFALTARIFYSLTGGNWAWSERLIWYLPFLLLSVYSSVSLVRTAIPPIAFWWLTPVIFLTNTYILMVTGGGQMGIAMAYAMGPLVLVQFIRLYQKMTYRQSVLAGLTLAGMVLFDPRIAYLLTLGIFIYWMSMMLLEKTADARHIYVLTIPFVVASLTHAFWILPLVVFRVNPIASLGDAYSSVASVRFFSFSDFSHALSLTHPNWPENLFGKTYFLQPEFLIIPLIAFSSLLYGSKSKNQRTILFFVFLGLLGSFLAKGASPPFGGVYIWLFEHVPGFNMFRDPTKFYLLIVLSYAVLIPFTLGEIGAKKWKNILLVLFLLYWVFAHREAVLGTLAGTFTPRTVPVEFVRLKDYLVANSGFSRVLWIPARQRYGYSSGDMPGISLETMNLANLSSLAEWMRESTSNVQLARYSVSYIIVPTDPFGELFVTDRRYDDEKRVSAIAALRADPDVKEIKGFGDIAVFQTKSTYGHVYFTDEPGDSLVIRRIAPTQYELILPRLDRVRTLVFSESYDPYWELDLGKTRLSPGVTPDGIQEYKIENFQGGRVYLRYRLQRFVYYGLVISGITLAVVIGFLVPSGLKKYLLSSIFKISLWLFFFIHTQ